MERSADGRVTETYLPDNTKVIGFRERRELEGYNQFLINYVYLVYTEDKSVLKMQEDGEIIIISATDRILLNEKGENKEDNDVDYYLQLFGVPDERKCGVYTANLREGLVWTRDDENNLFEIYCDGRANANIAVSLDIDDNVARPKTPVFNEHEYIDPINEHLPEPLSWVPPRLFIINNDNTGSEFLNSEQTRYFFSREKNDKLSSKIIEENLPGIPKS